MQVRSSLMDSNAPCLSFSMDNLYSLFAYIFANAFCTHSHGCGLCSRGACHCTRVISVHFDLLLTVTSLIKQPTWKFVSESVSDLLGVFYVALSADLRLTGTGFEPQDLIGRPFMELVHPDEYTQVEQLNRFVISNSTNYSSNYIIEIPFVRIKQRVLLIFDYGTRIPTKATYYALWYVSFLVKSCSIDVG